MASYKEKIFMKFEANTAPLELEESSSKSRSSSTHHHCRHRHEHLAGPSSSDRYLKLPDSSRRLHCRTEASSAPSPFLRCCHSSVEATRSLPSYTTTLRSSSSADLLTSKSPKQKLKCCFLKFSCFLCFEK